MLSTTHRLRSPSTVAQPQLESKVLEPKLQAWLELQGLPSQQLSLQLCGEEGRGLVAVQSIRKGQRLLQIPATLLLTVDAVMTDLVLGPVLRQQPLPEWSVLAAALAFWRLQAQHGVCTSRWAPYVEALPSDVNCVLQWAPGEAQRLLAGSPLLRKARSITAAAAATKAELLPLLPLLLAASSSLAQSPQTPPSYSHTLHPHSDYSSSARRNLQLRFTLTGTGRRWFRGRTSRTTTRGSAAASTGIRRCDACTWMLIERCSRGEQLHISYGPKSSGELLLQYGFAPGAETNAERETYTLEVGMVQSDPLLQVKQELLAEIGLPPVREFPLQIGGWASGLLQYLAFVSVWPKGLLDKPSQLTPADVAEMLLRRGEFPSAGAVCMERFALQQLSSMCSEALNGYPTSMEYDKSLQVPQSSLPVSAEVSYNTVRTSSSSTSGSSSVSKGSNAGNSASNLPGSSPKIASSSRGKKRDGSSRKSTSTVTSQSKLPPTPREVLCASIRVKERQILQRSEFVATSQLRQLKRRAREADVKNLG
ncbi:MAG: hypothetical protein WDW36_008649 [Sanguina aurantia]